MKYMIHIVQKASHTQTTTSIGPFHTKDEAERVLKEEMKNRKFIFKNSKYTKYKFIGEVKPYKEILFSY